MEGGVRMSIEIDGNTGILQNTTEVTKIPVGTTAQRPSNPILGMIRFNTDEEYIEWYDDVVDDWIAISSAPILAAFGGTITDIEQNGQQFRIHEFNGSGTFEVARGGVIDVLVVGGGGPGGWAKQFGDDGTGGAGAGGVVLVENKSIGTGNFTVTVGNGGAASTEQPGEDSIFDGITALGGGHGGIREEASGGDAGTAGGNGGSGGGGFGINGAPAGSALQPGTNAGAIFDNGNDGGSGTSTGTWGIGGGGGGASESGSSGGNGADAGDGLDLTNTFGTSVGENGFFGGGGGGSGEGTTGSGGIGGGGDSGISGVPNTGGGGGNRTTAGGSGVVIIKYRIG